MLYSGIKNHIINKGYYWSYSLMIFITLCLVFFSHYGSILSLLFFYLSIMAICCILINLYRCRSFYKIYNNFLKEHNAQFNSIVIEKESYKMLVPHKSYNATIKPFPKPTNAVSLETDDFLLLFFSTHYLGLFQQVLKPFIFIKTDKELCIKDKNANIIRDFKAVETGQNKTIIFPNRYGIKKVIIPLIDIE